MVKSAIVPAAGRSERFGRDKRLEPIDGIPMFLHAALKLKRLIPDTLIVLADTDAVHCRLAAGYGIDTTFCPRARLGMGHSLAHAIGQRPDSDGWLVMPADMPFIRTATLRKIIEAADRHLLAAPVFQGRRGHPVWFGHSYFGALCALVGDRGGRAVIEGASEDLFPVAVDDPGCLQDVDRPADLVRPVA